MWKWHTLAWLYVGVGAVATAWISYTEFKRISKSTKKIEPLSFDDASKYTKHYSPPISISIYEQENNEFIIANVAVICEKYQGNGFYVFHEIREDGCYVINLDLSDGAYRIVRQGLAYQVPAR